MTLFDCQVGEKAEVLGVSGERAIRKRLIDMGIDRMGIGYRSTPVVLGLK